MKRCPKCSRTFPDESQKFCTVDGGLLISDPVFDPNVTIRATAADVAQFEQPQDVAATSRELPNLNATIASMANAPTVAFPRNTGPTGTSTGDMPPPPGISTLPGATTNPPQAKKKSKLPLILGAVAFVLLLGAVGLAVVFFYVIKPRLDGVIVARDTPGVEESNTNTTAENTNTSTNTNSDTNTNTNSTTEETAVPFVPPPGTKKFANTTTNLDGKLAEHYIEFTFYYPETWQVDKKAGVSGSSNFVRVERRIPPDFTQENFAVGWYNSKGNFEADNPTFPRLVEQLGASLAKSFPEYRKVSEGPTKVNSLDGYEFRFVSVSRGTEKGDLQLWGRVVFLPTGIEGHTSGATLIMFTTSLAPELSGVEDVGVKGEMPVILESFRFATN
ncbi:MAG: hypothetical protein ND895_04985 [Pyrinomonadaceae bacterium]|nr:hypothetical protein [Pyrinomonadaceae bacterium]